MKSHFLTAVKITTCIGLLLLTTGRKGLAQVFTLSQVLKSIEERNPGLQQFELKTKSSEALGDAARSWEAPTLGAGLSEFPYPANDKMDNGTMPRKMLMFRLQQMFPNFYKQKKEASWHQSFARQNADDKATMQNMLFAKAKIAYADAYIAEKKLAVVNEQEEQLKLLIKIAEGRLAYNEATLPNIYKARARLSDLESTRIKISSVVTQATATMNSLMNRPADSALLVDTSAGLGNKQVDILQVDSAFVLAHRSDIMHTVDEIHSMELEKKVSAAAAKPVFGITWDNMRMNSGMYMYNAMAMVSIPIAPWFSKGYRSKIHSIDYQIDATQKMKASQVLEAVGNIRKDWLNLQSSRKDLQLFQTKVIPAYAKTYQANLNAFSENTGNIYETLMAWNDLTMKKMEYYDKLANMLNISVVLETEMQQY